MQADDSGLIHGGFVFGMADYAAMLAVNDPNVVLGAADVRFTKPCRLGEKLTAKARILEEKGKKRMVEVIVGSGTDTVFEGTFTCFVLEKHVLAGKE
jgi:acyl-coenzyme A thioesterase PaaI-like protein